ncbi:MAG: hypothetical protein R6U32_06180 [Candidatus Woesearchaeota archaeon]
MHTWFDYTLAIVGGIIIFAIIFFVISSGAARVEREIEGKSAEITAREMLSSYLASPLSEEDYEDEEDEIKDKAEKLADEGLTTADIVILAGGTTEKDIYKEILKTQTISILNQSAGGGKWKLEITYPDSVSFMYGSISGETRVAEAKLPSLDYRPIRLRLMLEKEVNR